LHVGQCGFFAEGSQGGGEKRISLSEHLDLLGGETGGVDPGEGLGLAGEGLLGLGGCSFPGFL